MEGTATNVAKQRIELHCTLVPDHEGPHRDASQAQEWVVVQGRPSLVLRHESEA